MSPIRVTWSRTSNFLRGGYSTAVAVATFLAAAGVIFAHNLEACEGGGLSLASIWAVSVSPVLPVLAALLGMDVWSDEVRSGRIRLLLSSPVRERDFTIGKFMGVWSTMMIVTIIHAVFSIGILALLAPAALAGASVISFLFAIFALAVQGVLWSAIAVAQSALTSHGAAAAAMTVVLTVGLPRGLWSAATVWFEQGRTAFGEMPIDAHTLDLSSGVISSGVVLGYFLLAGAFLFFASKAVASYRIIFGHHKSMRITCHTSSLLAFVAAVLALALAVRLDFTADLHPSGEVQVSQRTIGVLSEGRGEATATCFMMRSDSRFRETARFLRALRHAADAASGLRLREAYVDPDWDLGASERLLERGAKPGSIVFEMGRRVAAVAVDAKPDERACAAAIRRLTVPPRRREVRWTVGHGEAGFDGYGPDGMSDIARSLVQEGYGNAALDLSREEVPADCALVVIAGARDGFSREESTRLETYLKGGGRLLILVDALDADAPLPPFLAAWGLRSTGRIAAGEGATLSGTDVVATEFPDNPVSGALAGSRIVLERPVTFAPAVTAAGTGADAIGFAPIARAGTSVVAASVERGACAGDDLAVRPTRIVVVGDATFARNAALKTRASANRDFFLNCAAWLSGRDTSAAAGEAQIGFNCGVDRSGRARIMIAFAGIAPGVVFVLLVIWITARRRRYA